MISDKKLRLAFNIYLVCLLSKLHVNNLKIINSKRAIKGAA